MATALQRRPVTNLLLATLMTSLPDNPVGDMVIPTGAGWTGVPNAPGATFTAYTVLVTLTASRSVGAFADSQSDWQITYMLESFGASREQCEWMADKARSALDPLAKQVHAFGTANYKIQQIRVDSIGAVNRVAVTEPAFYGQQDGMSLWLSKEIA
jgi:hypothetical protein